MKKMILLLTLLVTLVSCGINMGDRIDAEKLSVYFLENVEREKAIAFAKYWRDNGFIGKEKQVIQLEKEKGVILVKLIEKEEFHTKEISIEEEIRLQELERYLTKNIFQEEVEIVITDNTFRPIEKRLNR